MMKEETVNNFVGYHNMLVHVVRLYEQEVHKLPSKTTVLELIQWLRKKAEVK